MEDSFTINRKARQSSLITRSGIYGGKVVVPVETVCMPKGELKVRLEFVTSDGGKVYDDYINMPSLWWKLNYLIAACDPDAKLFGADGEQADFSTSKSFEAFIRKFDGLSLSFAVYTEEYEKRNGDKGTAYRVRPLDPLIPASKQLTSKVLAQIQEAALSVDDDGPDEVPF